LKSRLDRYFVAIRRGPNGEDVCMNPDSVKDPPLLLVEGEKAYGMDLDGKDGVATGKSCPHQEFTGVDGTTGVDNQLYRLLGCVYGFRSYGQFEANENENRKSNGKGMTLIEISDVDDVRNDPDVRVTIYRAVDQYTLDGSGRFLPFGSYRIDVANGKPRYSSTLRGKIVDGVLTTETGDVNLPFYGNYTYMNRLLRDMRLRLTLGADGTTAEGMAAGYLGVDQLMFYIGGLGPIQSSAPANCPSINVAAHEIADGIPIRRPVVARRYLRPITSRPSPHSSCIPTLRAWPTAGSNEYENSSPTCGRVIDAAVVTIAGLARVCDRLARGLRQSCAADQRRRARCAATDRATISQHRRRRLRPANHDRWQFRSARAHQRFVDRGCLTSARYAGGSRAVRPHGPLDRGASHRRRAPGLSRRLRAAG
jgi:hypothetical protein